MKIDKPEHQQMLLELLNAASYHGHAIDLAYEVKQAVKNADIETANTEAEAAEPVG